MIPEQNTNQNMVRSFSQTLAAGAGWMKLLGVLSIIGGISQVLSLVGLITGGLQIWMGVLLFQAANSAEQARATGDAYAFNLALGNVKTFFTISGVFALVGIILLCAALCFLVVLPMLGMIPFLIDPNAFNGF